MNMHAVGIIAVFLFNVIGGILLYVSGYYHGRADGIRKVRRLYEPNAQL